MTAPQLIRVKKYPNRRLYDASRSRHLTHEELYDLVVAGHTVSVTDSRSGVDITNLVLIQALLERSPEKMAAFPPEVSHLLVRASEQMLRSAAHGWLSQLMASIAPLATAAATSPLSPFGAISPLPPFNFGTPPWSMPGAGAALRKEERGADASAAPQSRDRVQSSRSSEASVGADGSETPADELATLRDQVARLSEAVAAISPSRRRGGGRSNRPKRS